MSSKARPTNEGRVVAVPTAAGLLSKASRLCLALLLLASQTAAAKPAATADDAAAWLVRSIDVVRVSKLAPSRLRCSEERNPQALAACVGRSIDRRPSVRIWPKRASQTLRDGWGNDVDMAVLLAALLRVQGYPSADLAVYLAANPGHAGVYLVTTAQGQRQATILDPYLEHIGPRVEGAWALEGQSRGAAGGLLLGLAVAASGGTALTALGLLGGTTVVGDAVGATSATTRVENVWRAARYGTAFNDRAVSEGFGGHWSRLSREALRLDVWNPVSHRPGVRNLATMNEGLVFFGDSLTRYKGGESDYPTHLVRLLGVSGQNAGREGDTSVDAWQRLGLVAQQRPRLVVVCLGGNDFMDGLNPRVTEQHLAFIIENLQAMGSIVAVVAYQPLFPRTEWSARYERLAERQGVYLLPDPWLQVQGDPGLTLDMVHPNAQGARLAAEALAPGVRELLMTADRERRRSYGGR